MYSVQATRKAIEAKLGPAKLGTDQYRITLCGSTKFRRAYQEWNARLTLAGHIVYTVGILGHSVPYEMTAEEKKRVDGIHLQKILLSEAIFVLDVNKYVGESTKNEVAYAQERRKPVLLLSETFPDWTESDCAITDPHNDTDYFRILEQQMGIIGRGLEKPINWAGIPIEERMPRLMAAMKDVVQPCPLFLRLVCELAGSTGVPNELRGLAIRVYRTFNLNGIGREHIAMKFMSEVDNPCPDLTLRGMYRKALLDAYRMDQGKRLEHPESAAIS